MTELKRCVIATRESPLAMWQALHVHCCAIVTLKWTSKFSA